MAEGTGHLALTNDAGRYGLRGVPTGERTVTVEMAGYAAQRMQVTVAAGQTTVLNLVLRPAAVELDELMIRQGQPRAEALERARTDLSVVAVQYARALDFNTESYARIEENDFRLVRALPLSTFSIDVDHASCANLRFISAEGMVGIESF